MYNIGLITIAIIIIITIIIIIIIFTCSAFNLPTVLDTSLLCFTTWKLRYPLPGWTGEHDWQTFVAHQDLPKAFDPPVLWQPKNGWFSVVFYCLLSMVFDILPWFSMVSIVFYSVVWFSMTFYGLGMGFQWSSPSVAMFFWGMGLFGNGI